MKNIIIDRLEKIKFDEDYFKSKWWKNNYISYTKNDINYTKQISDVDLSLLDDMDLVRIFEYVILCRNDISRNRVNATYFKLKNENRRS